MEFNKTKLKDISTKITKGTTPSKESFNGKDVIYIKSDSLNYNGFVDTTAFVTIDKTTHTGKLKRSILKENDILYSIAGAYLGKVGLVKKEYLPANTNQAVGIISINNQVALPKYVYYYLQQAKVKYFANNSISQSAQPNINLEQLGQFDIALCGIEEQQKVVDILDIINKKIELNNQINDNLYKIMRLKFNEWIEDLEDYEISNLSSIANYKNGLAMQKYRPENENGLPVIKIKEMNAGVSAETEKCKSDIDPDVIVNNGDVLFAWSGTLCMTIWDNGKAGLNQHIFKVTSNKYPKWFYYFWTLKHLDKFIQIAAGKATTMGHIKRGELDLAEVLIPNAKELKNMNNIMSPILDKFIQNRIENRNLEQLRDTLLPKLMNGEINLEKVEI